MTLNLYVTQVTHLLFFNCKIGDFKIAGRVCLQKKFVYDLSYKVIFWWFLKLCFENELNGKKCHYVKWMKNILKSFLQFRCSKWNVLRQWCKSRWRHLTTPLKSIWNIWKVIQVRILGLTKSDLFFLQWETFSVTNNQLKTLQKVLGLYYFQRGFWFNKNFKTSVYGYNNKWRH